MAEKTRPPCLLVLRFRNRRQLALSLSSHVRRRSFFVLFFSFFFRPSPDARAVFTLPSLPTVAVVTAVAAVVNTDHQTTTDTRAPPPRSRHRRRVRVAVADPAGSRRPRFPRSATAPSAPDFGTSSSVCIVESLRHENRVATGDRVLHRDGRLRWLFRRAVGFLPVSSRETVR